MKEIDRFYNIMKILRSKDGCPWDSVQTFETLKPCCIEEASEVICGINILNETGNFENLKEELGDLLMVIVLQSLIAEEDGLFSFEDVVNGAADKMIRRHPNVFADKKDLSAEQQTRLWDEIKKQEKKGKEWMENMLPHAFEESKDLIERAKIRKGYD